MSLTVLLLPVCTAHLPACLPIRKLEADGHRCTSIQGGMTHEERDAVIREYRAGTTKILIATDVLARGFDQAQVRGGGRRGVCAGSRFLH